eukprot:9287751-Pyramimonas_sp.AAC.1
MGHATATLRAEARTNSSNLIGMLQDTERVTTQRLDATNAVVQPPTNRISAIEQRFPGAQDALAELRVGRAQTGQLDSPPT